jgi:hypothetical protein
VEKIVVIGSNTLLISFLFHSIVFSVHCSTLISPYIRQQFAPASSSHPAATRMRLCKICSGST